MIGGYGIGGLLLGLCLAAGPRPGAAQVVVIGHAGVPADSLGRTTLLDFYTGETRSWGNGQRVVVFDVRTKGPVRDSFYSYLGKPPSRMKSIWLKRKLSGEGDPPETLETEAEVVQRVSTTPGAIGFVSRAAVRRGVKILARIPLLEGKV